MTRAGVFFALCILAVTAGALALRLPGLDRRPMHCDEANQAVKTGILLETGRYRYDPHEHHGPSLYWLTLPSLRLGPAEDFARSRESQYRIVPVVFAAAGILLLLLVGDGLGRPAAVLAGVLAAISPAMVFYSRYYVQETLLVCFTFAAIGCGWRYVRSRRLGLAIATGACVGLMHATKETWVLSAAAAVAGLVLAASWARWRDGTSGTSEGVAGAQRSDTPGPLAPLGTYFRPRPLVAAILAFGLVAVALYSSFGTHWKGPIDSVLAYVAYIRRAGEPGLHTHPWYYYLQLLTYNRPGGGFFWTEGLIVGLAAVGSIASLVSREKIGSGNRAHRIAFCRFLAFYTLVLTALYAVIPYKTPWCMLGFLHGMILLAGVGAWTILRAVPTVPLKGLAAVLLIVGVVHLERQCQALNFCFFADQRNPYVYAHASSDVVNLAAQMERLAAVSPQGHEMVIHVVTPENYWPLPWYLRRFNRDRVGYWQDPATWQSETRDQPSPSVIILTPDVQEIVDGNLRAGYNKQMMYGLQPGVILNVYARADLWAAFLTAASEGGSSGP